jgi:cytochrome d ubiquinol oxidase subunit I
MAMGPAGFAAVLAGWTVTETGRQPFTVYGLLRTVDSASPIATQAVTFSLLAFAIVYFVVFAMGTYYILHLMAAAPHRGEEGPDAAAPSHAAGITARPPVPATASPKGGA